MIGQRLAALAALLLAACSSGSSAPGGSGTTTFDASDTKPYSGIGPREVVHFTGTEPFWGGQASDGSLTYSTPDNQPGETITVSRFAGRNGLSYSGDLGGRPFVLAITPGQCSDGMSDRSYPFAVTLKVRGEQRQGCAWTDKHPFTGAQQP
ncbi:MAG TPA: hypothetical protein VL331_10720 [Croceibacterium sp.]|nr:hypothetical protein [Croceibacterium sp.]